MTFLWSYLSGAGAVLVGWLIAGAAAGQWQPFRLAEGADGRLSVSKLQWMLWTVAVVFGYVATFVARGLNGGDITTGINLPSNLLIAMGFSTATMATAKGITSLYVAQGRVVKTQAPPPAPAAAGAAQPPGASYWSDLAQDDTNQSDLSKVQLLIWTAIAVGAFLSNVVLNINSIDNGGSTANPSLPDIDAALMVLMGLSQGGYLGKKLVTSNSVKLFSLLPPSISRAAPAAPAQVALVGSGFGAPSPTNPAAPEDPSSMLLLNGYRAANVARWSDSRIVFSVDPANDPSGTPWAAGAQNVTVSVVVAGQAPLDPTGAPLTQTLAVTP